MSEVQSIAQQVSVGSSAPLSASDSLLPSSVHYANRAVLLPQPDLDRAAPGIVVDVPGRFGSTGTRQQVTERRLLRRRLGWTDLATVMVSWGFSTLLMVRGPIYGRLSSAGAAAIAMVIAAAPHRRLPLSALCPGP